jgi:hypothetical protein
MSAARVPRASSSSPVMKRRTFFALVPGSLLAAPIAVEAQPAGRSGGLAFCILVRRRAAVVSASCGVIIRADRAGPRAPKCRLTRRGALA